MSGGWVILMIIKLRSVTQVINWAYRITNNDKCFRWGFAFITYISNVKILGGLRKVCSTSIQISIVSKMIDSWRITQHQCTALSFMWKWSCNFLSFVFLIVAAHNYGYLITHTRNGTVFNLCLINDHLVLTFRERVSFTPFVAFVRHSTILSIFSKMNQLAMEMALSCD